MFRNWIIKLGIKYLKEIENPDLKREVLIEAVKKLYNTIGPDDILKQNPDGSWIFQGKPLMGAEITQLREEAQFLRGMKLWKIIKWDIRYQLGKKMFEEARVKEDLVWGQLLTFLDDIIRNRIQKM